MGCLGGDMSTISYIHSVFTMLFGSIFLGKKCTGKKDRCTMFGCNNDRFFQLQLQLYSFTFNLQLHDSFHPRIGEPNRGGGRDTQI